MQVLFTVDTPFTRAREYPLSNWENKKKKKKEKQPVHSAGKLFPSRLIKRVLSEMRSDQERPNNDLIIERSFE